jgi:nucleotide-binding universal stress UspA family protein
MSELERGIQWWSDTNFGGTAMYKRMLVAMGNDPPVDTPINYAVAFAADTGAELWFLQVLTVPMLACDPGMGGISTLVIESVMETHEYVLDSAVAAAEAAGVPYTVRQRWGVTSKVILHTAEEADCDLIVMGTPGDSRWHRFLRGHIARQVIAKAQQPVLVVGPACQPDPGLWSRLLVIVDDTPSAEVAIEHALALAQRGALDVCLLYIDTASRHPPATPAGHALIRAAARATVAGVHYDIQRASGNALRAILENATRQQCDAIILGMHEGPGWKRRWYSRMPRLVMAHSLLPVLLVNR